MKKLLMLTLSATASAVFAAPPGTLGTSGVEEITDPARIQAIEEHARQLAEQRNELSYEAPAAGKSKHHGAKHRKHHKDDAKPGKRAEEPKSNSTGAQ